jgi:SAM-dependent methyltransferase
MTMSDWSAYASKVLGESPANALYRSWQFHAPSLGYLLAFRPPPATVLSIGCSLGLFDALLVAHGYRVLSVDNDPAVLEAAAALSRDLQLGLRLEPADAFDLSAHHGRFDVAYSAGLVEHWHGQETARLLREHARCAPLVQVEVPTPWTYRVDSVQGVVEDMHPFRAREFRARVREAGLSPRKVYPLGGVPTRWREVLESALPPVLFRRLQLAAGLSMGVGIIATR